MVMDPVVRLTTYLHGMREKHQVDPQGAKVYVCPTGPGDCTV